MRAGTVVAFTLALMASAFAGCAYYPAATPEDPEAPLIGTHKLLFMMDTDPRLDATDTGPCYRCEPYRIRAVREVIESHLPSPGVSFGIGVMGGTPLLTTFGDQDGDGVEDQVFLRDVGRLEMGLAQLNNLVGEADLQSAVELAWGLLNWEAPEPGVDPDPPVTYHLVFLLAGNPSAVDDELWRNTPESILEATRQLMGVEQAVPSFSLLLHTGLLSTGLPPDQRREAVDLLASMAEIGGGEFREFPEAADLDFTGL